MSLKVFSASTSGLEPLILLDHSAGLHNNWGDRSATVLG